MMRLRKRNRTPTQQDDEQRPEASCEKVHKCIVCEKVYSRADTLKTHLESVHGKSSIKCLVCSRVFSTNGALRRHQLTHDSEKAHRCELCPKSFKRADALTNHMCTVHSMTLRKPRKEDDAKEIVLGPRCDYCVEKKSPLISSSHHLISVITHGRGFPGGKPYTSHQCLICFQVTSSCTRNWQHEHFRHSKTASVTKNGHQCNRCLRLFASQKTLKQHGNHSCFSLDSSEPLFDCSRIEDKCEAWRNDKLEVWRNNGGTF